MKLKNYKKKQLKVKTHGENKMKKFGLKGKLVSAFLLTGLVPMMGIGYYTYQQSKTNLEIQAVERLKAIRDVKKYSLERYFNTVREQVLTLSDNVGVQEAMVDFSDSFNDVIKENNYTRADIISFKAALKKFYINEFGKKYNTENESSMNASKLMAGLSDTEIVHQYHYIANNSSELGAKDGLDYTVLQDSLKKIPKAPGLYRPHLETGNLEKEIPGWGISMVQKKGLTYLVRFEMKSSN